MRRAVLTAVLVAASAITPAAAQANVHFLDSYDRGGDPYAGPLQTERLTRNVPYRVAVRGTFSLFSRDEIKGPICGRTEPRPIYPSKGRPNGAVVADAEFLFADVSKNCSKRPKALTASTFQLKTSTAYRRPTPIGGVGDAPKPNHSYTYAVKGAGKLARFRLADSFTKDNYGRLRITIARARARDCANNGFTNWKFVDEASCVAATKRPIKR